jgi:hypothetical protein
MLKANSHRACATFAADYEPQVDFQARLPGAAEACRKKLDVKQWALGAGALLLRDIEKRVLLTVDHRRVGLQFLGMTPLQADVNRYSAVVRLALDKMAVQKLQRIGMKIQVFLSLKMSHEELVKLMFGTFFAPAQDLESLCGKIDDGLVQLHGTRGGMKLVVVVVPFTAEQATTWFMAFPNLEHFLEPKLLDTGVKDFKDRIAEDGLLLDIDLSRLNADPEDVPYFFTNVLQESEAIADGVTRMLKTLPATGGR